MGNAKKSTWIGGTLVLALLLVAASWFLAISPVLASTSEVRDQTAQTEAQNIQLGKQVTQLKADFEKLPEYKAELAALQVKIPTDAMLTDYLRQLDTIAVAHAVTLTSIAPNVPQAVVPATPETPAPEPSPSTTESTTAETDTTAAAPKPPAAPAVPAGFTAIQFSITVLGTYDNTQAFLADLQNATPRLFLVSGITGTGQDVADASGGKPATAVGDQELVITGFTYVLPDALGVPAPVDPNAAPPALPGAVPGKNPLVPVDGR